jgi:CheY-like chemotaxis protein
MVMAKILVVEDENLDLFVSAINALSNTHEIIVAERGDDAVRLAREQRPDAIIMDIRLPGIDGLEATRQIREFDLSVPIFAVTAYGDKFTREEAERAGVNLYLPKPTDFVALVAHVEKALDKVRE